MIELQKPDNLNPTLLWQQMKDAGLTDTNWMYVDQDETGMGTIIRFLDLPDSDQEKVEAIFEAHSEVAVAEEVRVIEHATNENSVRNKALNALATNKTDISQNDAWLAANPNAPAVQKELVRQSTAQAKQLNAIIRMLFDRFEATD